MVDNFGGNFTSVSNLYVVVMGRIMCMVCEQLQSVQVVEGHWISSAPSQVVYRRGILRTTTNDTDNYFGQKKVLNYCIHDEY